MSNSINVSKTFSVSVCVCAGSHENRTHINIAHTYAGGLKPANRIILSRWIVGDGAERKTENLLTQFSIRLV